jgi:hypothetical protein
MALSKERRIRSAFKVIPLIGLMAAAWYMARGPMASETSRALDQIQTVSWTFVASDFQEDDGAFRGTYVSPVRRSDFPFTGAGVHFGPVDGAASAQIPFGVELRLREDGQDWSPWYAIDGFELEADGQLYGENLVTWSQPREVQVRVRSDAAVIDAISDLTVIAINASAGPTAAQAASLAQSATDDGDLGVPKPVVISREEWGANESWMTWPPYYAPVEKMMVHHTVSGGGADPAAEVRSIYYYHAVSRGWGDIGYNFLVDPYGNIYEGRYGGPDVIGAHVAYWNANSMGMSVLGCYDNGACSSGMVPREESLNAIADLVAWASSRRVLDPRELREFSNGYSTVTNYVLAGHRDYGSTVCPGANLYAQLPNLREMAWQRVPEYDVRFGWHDTPTKMQGGTVVDVHPSLYNYGRLEWSDDIGVRLGYRWMLDGQVVAENIDAARIIPGAVVKSGEMTSLVAKLTAPEVGGTYTLRWDLYRDGVGWFGDQGAPAGHSDPLDVQVEVTPVLSLDMQMVPPAVEGGGSFRLTLTIEGPKDKSFETLTQLPAEFSHIVGSDHKDIGTLLFGSSVVTWTGILNNSAVQASFDVLVSPAITTPSAFPNQTELIVADFDPLVVERWSVVNGYHHYFALIGQKWAR